MDHKFSVVLHSDPRLVDIVDIKWATQKLVFDDIEIPQKDKPKSIEDELEDDVIVDETEWNETLQFD